MGSLWTVCCWENTRVSPICFAWISLLWGHTPSWSSTDMAGTAAEVWLRLKIKTWWADEPEKEGPDIWRMHGQWSDFFLHLLLHLKDSCRHLEMYRAQEETIFLIRGPSRLESTRKSQGEVGEGDSLFSKTDMNAGSRP